METPSNNGHAPDSHAETAEISELYKPPDTRARGAAADVVLAASGVSLALHTLAQALEAARYDDSAATANDGNLRSLEHTRQLTEGVAVGLDRFLDRALVSRYGSIGKLGSRFGPQALRQHILRRRNVGKST